MKIIIFGSTGTIGLQLVKQSLESGHTVTAFVRNPGKLELNQHKNLKVFQGNVLDFESVAEAVKGHDVVLCALGAGRKGIVRSAGTRNIIKAMEKCGINRFICQTTLGCGESNGNLNFFWKNIMFGWFLKEAFIDHELQEDYIKSSHLSWTIVRPAAFTNGALTSNFRQGFSHDDKSIKAKISRADVAHFMLEQVQSDKYVHDAVGISY